MLDELISVIIPVFNVEEYLERCLYSILINTYIHFEVICVNDGSTDNSLTVLQGIAEKDSRIRIYSQENRGVSAARNLGIEKATGKYITFIDADDFVHVKYLETLLKCIQETGAGLVYSRFEQFDIYNDVRKEDSMSDITGRYYPVELHSFLNDHSARAKCWGRLYHRRLIGNIRFPEGIVLGEDTIFVLRYLNGLKKGIFCCEDELYYYYHGRSNSAIHSVKTEKVLDCIDVYINDSMKSSDQIKSYCIISGLKEFLSFRYNESITNEKDMVKKKCKNYSKRLLRQLRMSNTSLSEKIGYHMFCYIPLSYRVFRILKDPTLWTYERSVKNNIIAKKDGR